MLGSWSLCMQWGTITTEFVSQKNWIENYSTTQRLTSSIRRNQESDFCSLFLVTLNRFISLSVIPIVFPLRTKMQIDEFLLFINIFIFFNYYRFLSFLFVHRFAACRIFFRQTNRSKKIKNVRRLATTHLCCVCLCSFAFSTSWMFIHFLLSRCCRSVYVLRARHPRTTDRHTATNLIFKRPVVDEMKQQKKTRRELVGCDATQI